MERGGGRRREKGIIWWFANCVYMWEGQEFVGKIGLRYNLGKGHNLEKREEGIMVADWFHTQFGW